MDEMLKTATVERATKNTLHRANKDWNNKIATAVAREIKTPLDFAGDPKKKR